jgi:nicotinate phosphoribosyltransferase
MSFETEAEAFAGYADVMPNNCVFLVDTYDTLQGVHKAVEVGQQLRERGHKLGGIRLDSGDLAYLSVQAREILDAAGFPEAVIVASNDLDERIIESLKAQDAKISVWGVGTRLATAYEQPALGGVYKLGALKDAGGDWQPKVKLSEQAVKTSIPGVLQVRRFETSEGLVGDMIYDETSGVDQRRMIVDIKDPTRRKSMPAETGSSELLQPVMREGRVVAQPDELAAARARAQSELAKVHPSIRRFVHPHEYPVGIDIGLHELRDRMIQTARGHSWTAREAT